MTPLRRIALMTQWTEFDSGAESVALELAQRLKLPMTVVVPLLSNPEFEVVAHELVAQEEAATATAVASFSARARAAGVAAEIRVRRGDEPWREVVDDARSAQFDLLVTRRRGHRGFLGKLRVGEMVRQIAARAPCPVMMVPRAAGAPRRGILAVVESGAVVEPEVRSAAALAGSLGIPLGVLVVVADRQSRHRGEALLQRAADVARQAHLSIDGGIAIGSIAAALASRTRANPVDLLVIGIATGRGSHGKLGATVEAIVGEASCATLLVGAPAPAT